MKVPADNSSEFCCAKPTSLCTREAWDCADLHGIAKHKQKRLLTKSHQQKRLPCAKGAVAIATEGLSYFLFSVVSICSTADRTAAIIKAVNVQLVPAMTLSTFFTTSSGKRIVLLVVGGITGILKDGINFHLVFKMRVYYTLLQNKKLQNHTKTI